MNLGREFVNAVRASGQQRTAFHHTIETGNKTEAFTDSASASTSLPVVHLLLDVKTCWDFTYNMINHLCALRQACVILH